MAEMPSGPTIDPRVRDYLDAELRQAEADFARLPRPAGGSSHRRAPLATLVAAAVVLVIAVIAGSQLLGRPVVGPAGPSSTPMGSTVLGPSPTATVTAVPQASSSLATMTPEAFWSGLFSGDPAAVNYPSLTAMAKDSDVVVLGSFSGVAPGPTSEAGGGLTNYTMTVTLNVERVLGGDLHGATTVPISVFLGVDPTAPTGPYAEVIASRAASMPAERGVFFLQNVVAYYSRFDPTAPQRYDPTLYQVASLQGLVRDNAGTAWVPSLAPGTWAPALGGKPFDTVLATLAAAAEIVPSGSPAATASASPSASAATGATVGCGDVGAQFDASVLDGAPQLTGPDPAIAALRTFLAAGADPGMPASGWRTVVAGDSAVQFLAEGTAGWWFVTVVPDSSGTWQDVESGECHLAVHLPTTLGFAEWRLDPKHPPTPGSTTVTILGSELACASGKAPGSRLQAPLVLETDGSVTITLLVTRQGPQDCPSNPEFSVVVHLKAPLGSRSLLDGSTYPATPR